MSAAKKLIIVSPTAKFFRSHRLPIALGAVAAGYRVGIACPEDDESKLLKEDGLCHYPIPLSRSGMAPAEEISTLRALIGLFREQRPDIVHLTTAKPALHGGLACRILRIPSVTAVTGLGYLFMRSGVKARVLQSALLRAYRFGLRRRDNLFVFQNDSDRRTFESYGLLGKAGVEMVPGSGTDLNAIVPQPIDWADPVVLLPSRMLRDKGVLEFVEAARILKKRGVAARFTLLGDPDPDNPASLTLAELHALAGDGAVSWEPFAADIGEALARSVIVALPSYREGFPKSLIDAAAAGRAMVTTDVPGCRDAIIPGETGVLCESRSAESLAECIEDLLHNRARVEAMGEAARRDAERRFDIDTIVRRHLEFYARVQEFG